ncbi:MAG TPA: hypothetical protein VIN62_01185, partial [Candidatus Cryosericum sp.]
MSDHVKGFRHTAEGLPLTHVVGTSVDKIDGYSLVSGAPVYTDDIAAREFPHRLHGKILGSPIPQGMITSIDTSSAEELP